MQGVEYVADLTAEGEVSHDGERYVTLNGWRGALYGPDYRNHLQSSWPNSYYKGVSLAELHKVLDAAVRSNKNK
eukprot:2565262-Pyramimonas_sp.AAC.1